MQYVTICSIARREQNYIKDWCTYHLGLGIDHVVIYDNEYKPTYEDILRQSFSEKQVSVIHWPGETQQYPVYTHALNTNRGVTRYLGFIDVDEYCAPKETDSIPEVLKMYERYAGVVFHWRIFGSSGEKTYKPIPVPERFTFAAKEIDRHVKSFVDPQRTGRWVTAHRFTSTTPTVDEHFNPIDQLESRPEPATADVMQISHYVTKSYEESVERRSSPGASRADIAETRKMPEFFTGHDRNDVEDLRALELWNRIKKR